MDRHLQRHWRARAGLALLLAAACVTTLALHAQAELSRRESDSLERKILSIQHYANSPSLTGARLTPVSEAELNSYIRFALASDLPAGVVEPYISIVGNGEVRARAVVDLDAVRRAKPRGWLDPVGYVSGRVPVSTTGRVVARDGVARFEFWSAEAGGIPVSKAVLQEVVGFYSRTPESPRGVSLDDPIDLPARIRDITVEPGRAIVIQQ